MTAIYLRKSRADRDAEARGEGETLSRHEKILTELASQMGLSIGAVYKELVSGETIAARPRMQQLLVEVMQGKWDSVMVMEIERLARGDTKDQGTVAEAFQFSKTKIITPSKTYDPGNEFDEEYFEFNLFMSRREYKTINRRIQTGRMAAFHDGWYIAGTAPYGYKKVKRSGDKGFTLEIVEEEANIVRMIFRLYVYGERGEGGIHQTLGSYQIRDRLNSLHIPSKTGGSWSASSILDILQNPVYTGFQRWSRRRLQKTVIDGRMVQKRLKNEDCPLVRGRFEPLITQELFSMAQTVRKRKPTAHSGASNTLQNPLSGLLYCSRCRSLMTRQRSNTKARYAILRCPNSRCANVSSPLYLIENKVIDGLSLWTSHYELNRPRTSPEYPLEHNTETAAILESSMKTISAELEKTGRQLSNAFDLLEQGVYDLPLFQERQKVLEDRICSLKEELSRIQREMDKTEQLWSREFAGPAVVPAVRNIADVYRSTEDVEIRNFILKEVLDHIDYCKTERTKKGQRDSAGFTLHFYPKIPERI